MNFAISRWNANPVGGIWRLGGLEYQALVREFSANPSICGNLSLVVCPPTSGNAAWVIRDMIHVAPDRISIHGNNGFLGWIARSVDGVAEVAFSDRWKTRSMFLLLCVLGCGVFSVCLVYRPSDLDDLILLSSVARTENPLSYLVGDFGYGNNAYRPLQSLILWITYRLIGITAVPQQLLNIVLHLLNLFLLLRILRRIQRDDEFVFLIAMTFLISQHTYTAPAWVSDRATLLAALACLLVLDHLSHSLVFHSSPSLWYLALLCIFALLCKESGLVTVVLVGIYSVTAEVPRRVRTQLLAVTVLFAGCYVLARFVMFGWKMGSFFSQSGNIFFMQFYESFDKLPTHLRLLAMAENVMKAFIGVLLPVFGDRGGLYSSVPLITLMPLWGTNAVLALFAIRWRFSRMQVLAFAIIVLNSLAHYLLYRHRVEYIAWIGFSLLLGALPLADERLKTRMAIKGVLCVFAASSVVLVSGMLHGFEQVRYEEIHKYHFWRVFQEGGARIDSALVKKIERRYEGEN